MFRTLCLGSPLVLIAAAGAQIPVGAAVVTTISDPTNPIMIIERGTPPTILPFTGSVLDEINAFRIDPIANLVWMAGINDGSVRIAQMLYPARSVINDGLVAMLPPDSLAGIAFDIDGNPVFGGGSLSDNGGVWRVHRQTGAVRALVDNASGLVGDVNALCEDSETGTIYFGVHGSGNVYRISPPYALNSQVLVGTIAGVASQQISGLAFVRTAAVPQGQLYVSSFAASRNASIVQMNPMSGAVTVIPGTPPWFDVNAIEFDSVQGDLWLASTFAARAIALATPSGSNTMLHQLTSGIATAIDVNDVDPNKAVLRIFPRNVPVPTAPFRFEAAVLGNPGDLAAIAVVVPAQAVLAVGTVGPDGRFGFTAQDLVFPAGSPGSLILVGGTVDTTRMIAKFSDPVTWPLN